MLEDAAKTPTSSADEVDLLVAAWDHERPDLETKPLHVWSRIARLSQLLDGVRADVFAALDLQVWEFDVLAALRRTGEPYRLTPGQLIAHTHVTSGTMTNRVDRLAARGLVIRMSNPADGRGVLVELTDEGRTKVDAAIADLLAAERKISTILSPAQCSELASLLRMLLRDQERRELN